MNGWAIIGWFEVLAFAGLICCVVYLNTRRH